MIDISKIVDMVAKWLKPIPNLPVKWQKLLATNFWWITLIGVILLGMASIMILGVMSMFGAVTSYANIYAAQPLAGAAYFAALVSLLFMVVEIVLMVMAIGPLKQFQRKGWDLMFMTLLVSTSSMIIGLIINFNAGNIVSTIFTGVIAFFINAYFLYQIKSYFIKK